jgi:serralysin
MAADSLNAPPSSLIHSVSTNLEASPQRPAQAQMIAQASSSYGDIALDGNLNDWTSVDRLDAVLGTGQPGFEVYGKYAGGAYVFAIKSTNSAIGPATTVWLNTDQNPNTGYQIFGVSGLGGAEYNVNFFTDSKPYLYTGADGQNYITGPMNHVFGDSGKIIEFAVPASQLNGSPQAIDLWLDVNNQVFLPPDYAQLKYSISANTVLPPRTDSTKQVAIVYSQTTANQFFDAKAYAQLHMAMQYQTMMAGIPYNVITENDLTDISKLVNYDTIIFPAFRNVPLNKLASIESALTDAVYKYNIGVITAGDFMTNDEIGAILPGDPYGRMKKLIGLTRTGGTGPANLTVKANDVSHPVMKTYQPGEIIRSYTGGYYSTFAGVNTQPNVLARQEVNGQSLNAVLANTTGGRNVHFSTEAVMGDNNVGWQAVQWSVLGDGPIATLNMSRDASIFISRNDMDQSMYIDQVPTVEVPLYNILTEWKTNYDFVGSYYINVGNNPAQGMVTNWGISAPLYNDYIAIGNEIGTHSYTHPDNTSLLTPSQLEFEFNQSQLVIEQNMGIDVVGAAVPGNPEALSVAQEVSKHMPYLSGGYSGVGAGYPGAFGYILPEKDFVYFSPNFSFDFTLIGFKKMTAAQAEAVWAQEYTDVLRQASQPILHWPWHDYGPTLAEPGYTKQMFTNFIARAYNDNTEFVTAADLQQRIRTFERAKYAMNRSNNTITATVTSTNVGKFSLAVKTSSNQHIQNVSNWYAYDDNTVFLPKNGGQFQINVGTTQSDVTRIIDLPMRAELISVTGNGKNLDYTFVGQGNVVIDLPAGATVSTQGATSVTLSGDKLTMFFGTTAQHTGRVNVTQPTAAIEPSATPAVAAAPRSEPSFDLSGWFNTVGAIVKTMQIQASRLQDATSGKFSELIDCQPTPFGHAVLAIRPQTPGLLQHVELQRPTPEYEFLFPSLPPVTDLA